MKKTFTKTICVIITLSILLTSCILASASIDTVKNITVAETKNGSAEVSYNPENSSEVLVTLSPDEGYLTENVSLKDESGTSLPLTNTSTPNVLCCEAPKTNTTLKAEFRRTQVFMNYDELALNSGDKATANASLSYIDGELKTRVKVKNSDIIFSSTNEDVVSIDAKTGEMTANKMGFARITATAAFGNKVEDFFYVIVDGDKDEVIGTIQLNAHFDEVKFITYILNGGIFPGHSFLIFRNTTDKPITIKTSNMFNVEVPTKAFYDAVNSFDSKGFDPVTFYPVTNGEWITDETKEARLQHAAQYFTRYERGDLDTYTIPAHDIATFGNTGGGTIEEILSGDFKEVLTRYGKILDFEQLKADYEAGKLNITECVNGFLNLFVETFYDLSKGTNKFNGATTPGGECVNHEIYAQAYNREYETAVGCRTNITRVQLEAMVDFVQYNNYFTFFERNCTWVASDAWNLVTASKPQYHMEPNRGGITTALAAPMWLKNTILAKSVLLSCDKDIKFSSHIGVIKPDKTSCINDQHNFTLDTSTITRVGKCKCADCGKVINSESTLTHLTLKQGKVYNEFALGIWDSSDKNVAFTTFTGTVIAISKGTTTLTCNRNGKTYTCQLTVK